MSRLSAMSRIKFHFGPSQKRNFLNSAPINPLQMKFISWFFINGGFLNLDPHSLLPLICRLLLPLTTSNMSLPPWGGSEGQKLYFDEVSWDNLSWHAWSSLPSWIINDLNFHTQYLFNFRLSKALLQEVWKDQLWSKTTLGHLKSLLIHPKYFTISSRWI